MADFIASAFTGGRRPAVAGRRGCGPEPSAMLTTVYDIRGYDELIDYEQPPPGSLSAAESAWVDEQSRCAGRRKP